MSDMNFLIEWALKFGAVMLAMCLDNIFWIPTSPEYELYKNNKFPLKVENQLYYSKVDYILRYRVLSVLTHYRDIIPGLISSLTLAVMF